MALGSSTMKIAMKVAQSVTKITGISIKKTSAFTLKTAWRLIGGSKK
jgi:hypothetical protein